MPSWKVSHRTFGGRWELVPASKLKQTAFIAVPSSWTPGKPDLTLHGSADKSGPVIGVCHFEKFGGGMRIGIGDPAAGPQAVQWTEMSKTGWTSGEFSLPVLVEGSPRPLIFTWTRTRTMLSSRTFQLKSKSGRILAVFEPSGWGGTSGTLEIKVDMIPMLEHMVLITIMGIQEKIRRSTSSNAATSSSSSSVP